MSFEEFFSWFARTLTIGTVTGATYWGLNQFVAWRGRQPILWAVSYTRDVDTFTDVHLYVRNRAPVDLIVEAIEITHPAKAIIVDRNRDERILRTHRHIKPCPPMSADFPSDHIEFQCEPGQTAKGMVLHITRRRPRVFFLRDVTRHRVPAVMSRSH